MQTFLVPFGTFLFPLEHFLFALEHFLFDFEKILFANIFCFFEPFFTHVSTPTRTTRRARTTKLLLGPLSRACGQKMTYYFLNYSIHNFLSAP